MRSALERISAFAGVLARSRVYETKPVGGPPPDYLNAAVLVEWTGTPLELLDRLQAIEAELGRVRSVPNAPRTIDLDILWMEHEGRVLFVDEPRLVVPHPRLLERAFALRPLLDVMPGAYVLPTGMIEDLGCQIWPEALS